MNQSTVEVLDVSVQVEDVTGVELNDTALAMNDDDVEEEDEESGDDEMWEDAESVDSDSMWQRPVVENALEFEVPDVEVARDVAGWIFVASRTDAWIVDVASQRTVCKVEQVFGGLGISIHEYVPELSLFIVMTQAGAVALIQLVKGRVAGSADAALEMREAHILKPPSPMPYLGMFVKKRRVGSTTGRIFVELFLFAFDASVVAYDIRETDTGGLCIDDLIL
ncbi:hypothetical protein HDU98_010047 [Podochytrium sp. JEL0797]|nr:hypothetical protein HDU98_010047 [Podochytrium sp. JEL0797]